MGLFNVLSSAEIWLYGITHNINLDWIGELIRLLIIGVGSVGVGVILFSVILKVIVLPFDVYQRITMRKQNLKMKENQAKMEKLQKQYANNKEMYNQKVMEMYKESGISPCSSCLPLILSMVIFIVAINAFNAYAQFANVRNYNDMVHAYNTKLETYCADLTPTAEDSTLVYTVQEDGMLKVEDSRADKYIYYVLEAPENFDAGTIKATDYEFISKAELKSFYIDVDKAYENGDIKTAVDALKAKDTSEDNEAKKIENATRNYFISQAQKAVVSAYNNTVYPNSSFLWIKNVWETDAMYKTPVVDYKTFEEQAKQQKFKVEGVGEVTYANIAAHTKGGDNPYTKEAYDYVTGALTEQKSAPNGYFILIVLSIGTILLQQVISMRSQKEQQKYSSVDGQGATQQKTMLVVMTVMFAVFSFMYSSAFSIYMIMSNVLSLFSTLLINKIVDTVEAKKEEKALLKKYDNKRTYKEDDKKSGKKGK
jgi:membrane protein insertase Oxa1/YidC/SpoIIIJ